MSYIIITIVSIVILVVLVVWKSIKSSNTITSNVKNNIQKIQQANAEKIRNDHILVELRKDFLEAQTNGVDRIDYINELKKEIEGYLEKGNSQPTF